MYCSCLVSWQSSLINFSSFLQCIFNIHIVKEYVLCLSTISININENLKISLKTLPAVFSDYFFSLFELCIFFYLMINIVKNILFYIPNTSSKHDVLCSWTENYKCLLIFYETWIGLDNELMSNIGRGCIFYNYNSMIFFFNKNGVILVRYSRHTFTDSLY